MVRFRRSNRAGLLQSPTNSKIQPNCLQRFFNSTSPRAGRRSRAQIPRPRPADAQMERISSPESAMGRISSGDFSSDDGDEVELPSASGFSSDRASEVPLHLCFLGGRCQERQKGLLQYPSKVSSNHILRWWGWWGWIWRV